jgi:hypothetical protein
MLSRASHVQYLEKCSEADYCRDARVKEEEKEGEKKRGLR